VLTVARGQILFVLRADGYLTFLWVFCLVPVYFLGVLVSQPLTVLLLTRARRLCT
jgi:hypothetical protein